MSLMCRDGIDRLVFQPVDKFRIRAAYLQILPPSLILGRVNPGIAGSHPGLPLAFGGGVVFLATAMIRFLSLATY